MALTTQSMGPKKKAAKVIAQKIVESSVEEKPKKEEGRFVRYKDVNGVYAWKVI